MTRSFPDEAPGRLVAAVRAPTRSSSSAAERAGGHGSNYGLTTRRRRSPSTPEGPIWGQAVWKRHEVKGPGGFRVDRYCFRILKLGDFGDGDASVHRWRRS